MGAIYLIAEIKDKRCKYLANFQKDSKHDS